MGVADPRLTSDRPEHEPRLRVDFVGVGAIGLPMARRVAQAGFPLEGIEVVEPVRRRAAEAGLAVRASLAGSHADVVIVMVATGDQLAQVVQPQDGEDRAGQIWVIMSTVGPDAVRAAAVTLSAQGATVVDAPVSGGVVRARTGELRIFVAAEDDALIDRVAPILGAMGEASIVGRRVGDGQAVKVVNQHLCSVHLVAAAEALALAEGMGLDPEAVLGVVAPGAAGSFMLSDRGPRMLVDEPEVTSTVGIFVKDSGLVADAAHSAGVDVPVLDAARARFVAAADDGGAALDDSQVIRTYRS